MISKQFIVGTAGHVDHGKSSLVKALTGIDPDRLPEEKARGITIDLGFAHLELPVVAGDAASGTIKIGIVDVPGHEDFVKNMVAGVGSIDLALLVVAADDGWMPQTEEHLQILAYLGVNRGVIALTKADLIQGDGASVAASIREKLENTPLADAPIVKTSVVSGQGIEELKGAMARLLADAPPPRDTGKPRLPVDRAFTLRGIGTVVTGTLIGGRFSRGQAVVVQPSGQPTRIRSIQSHNQEVDSSGPGTRTALNLPDLSVAGKGAHAAAAEGVRRGEVVTLAELGAASRALDVLLAKSARLAGSKSKAARPLKEGTIIRVHHGSGNWRARVYLLDHNQIGPGEQSLAELRFDEPIFAFIGDRFIVRDWAEQATLAGGVVLDPDAIPKNFRSEPQRKFLQHMSGALQTATLCLEAQLERAGAAPASALLVKSGFSAPVIHHALSQLAAGGKAFISGDLAASATWWAVLRAQAEAAIAAEHRTHPERPGLMLNQLRSALEKQLPTPEVFEALVAELCKSGCVQTGAAIRRTTHRLALPSHLEAAGNSLRAALAAKPIEPPSRKELAPDSVSQAALRYLIETGEAVELGEELVLLTKNFNCATGLIKAFLRERGSATVSDLRQALATSRRIMLPILERLDREGVTLRQGDKRILKRSG
jgi:selenocysteine-specific elongation factor